MTDGLFLKACRCEAVERPPIWMMRQAGRYLPEYQAVRQDHDFLEICRTPALAAEVTLQPVNILGFDAAILFSDILVPIEPMGLRLDFIPGPKLENPVRTMADVEALKMPEPGAALSFVTDAITKIRGKLPPETALIGFVGAPFTVASYMVEGEHGRQMSSIRERLSKNPEMIEKLMMTVARFLGEYSVAQIKAGAQAIQIFESWAELLGPEDYARFALPGTKLVMDIIREASPETPIILFAKDAGAHLDQNLSTKPDVIGLDWRIDLTKARDIVPDDIAMQGNLDPAALLGTEQTVREKTRAMLAKMAGRDGYIVNLGHGVLPNTPPANVRAFVEAVKQYGANV